MRVRGFKGEFDRLFPPHMNEHGEDVLKYGFEFYEMLTADRWMTRTDDYSLEREAEHGLTLEAVRRPVGPPVEAHYAGPFDPDNLMFAPDKGWRESLEHFARCFIEGTEPLNADGQAGAVNTTIVLALLESSETGLPVEIR